MPCAAKPLGVAAHEWAGLPGAGAMREYERHVAWRGPGRIGKRGQRQAVQLDVHDKR